jgi:hypothetical protein
MDDTQDSMRQEDGSMVEEQNEGLGIDPISAEESGDTDARDVAAKDEGYTDAVRKRIHQQAKKHHREMRVMQDQLSNLQVQLGQGRDFHQQPTNPYNSPGQPNAPTSSEEERIQKAVRYALDAKDAESRKAKEAESQAHVQRQYQRLHDEFDKASDKYEDFDDVVRGDAPFSPAMRDALLFVDNPAEVAYKLGKNRQELSRLSQLHPLDQAREINKLSFALMNGNGGKASSSPRSNPINPLRANPVNNSSAVTEKTPVSNIRTRMKQGTWK